MVRVGPSEQDEQDHEALRRPWHVHGPVVHDVIGCVYLSYHPPDRSIEYLGFPEVPVTDDHNYWLSVLVRDPMEPVGNPLSRPYVDHVRWSRIENLRQQQLFDWRNPDLVELRRREREQMDQLRWQQVLKVHTWVRLVMGYLRLKRIRTLWSYLGTHLKDVKAIGKKVNEKEDARQQAREDWKRLVTRYMQHEGSWEREEDDSRSQPQQSKGSGKAHCWYFQNHRSTQCKGAAKAKGKNPWTKQRPTHRG